MEVCMNDNLKSIVELGFAEVGKWTLGGGKISPNLYDKKKKGGGGWVYAFVVGKDKEVKYIGKTDREDDELLGRMGMYRNGAGTNSIRIRNELKKVLENSAEVLIYAISLDEIKTKKIIDVGGKKTAPTTTSAFEMIAIGMMNDHDSLWNIEGTNKQNLPKCIKALGFQFKQVGEWKLENGKLFAALDENGMQRKDLFYFFASNDKKIIHVGMTDRTLETKMGNYKDKSGRTNNRKNKEIKDVLERKGKVFIYAASDNGTKNGIKSGIRNELEKEWKKDEENEND
jgi:hypothetical protein